MKAVSLISGGIDSTLATKIILDLGIEVEGVNFRSELGCCKEDARRVCDDLGIRFTLLEKDDEYLRLIRAPVYQYGRGLNPCCDCRIYMFRGAARYMRAIGADFVISGEVLGQRPNSQMRHHLAIIERDAGLADRLLRPLSAKLLAPTLPERTGAVDRARLYAFAGRQRTPLFALARALGIREIPTPSTGCALTEPDFARKVQDLLDHTERESWWDYHLLKIGRHFRLADAVKAVVGKDADDNAQLERAHRPGRSLLVQPANFPGPAALLVFGAAAAVGGLQASDDVPAAREGDAPAECGPAAPGWDRESAAGGGGATPGSPGGSPSPPTPTPKPDARSPKPEASPDPQSAIHSPQSPARRAAGLILRYARKRPPEGAAPRFAVFAANLVDGPGEHFDHADALSESDARALAV